MLSLKKSSVSTSCPALGHGRPRREGTQAVGARQEGSRRAVLEGEACREAQGSRGADRQLHRAVGTEDRLAEGKAVRWVELEEDR